MTVDRSAGAPPLAIRRLWPAERSAIRAHLLRLDRDDRSLRFCNTANDAVITSYCANIDWLRATVLGCFVEGELRGVAELIRIKDVWPPTAELALSVEGPYQNHGIGSALLRRALVMARNRLIGTVYMICLVENRKMQHIARDLGASLVVREGQVEGAILAPWPSYLSLIEEVAAEGEALGKNRSFISQISDPAYSTPIPAQHIEHIVELCHFSPSEKQSFMEAYSRAHPRHARRAAQTRDLRRLVLQVPDLGDADLNTAYDHLVSDFADKMGRLLVSAAGD